MNYGYTLQASLIEQTLYRIKMGIKSTIIDLANVFGTMFKIDVFQIRAIDGNFQTLFMT